MIWDASDANPMHRRIPAEVVSRRARAPPKKPVPQEKEKEPEEVTVDLRAAIVLKPEARPRWLSKACKMVSDGRASSTELYNIIVSRKFASGLPERVGRKLVAIVEDSLDLFSDKQQRCLSSSDCPLMAHLRRLDPTAPEPEQEEVPAAVEVDRERDAADAALALMGDTVASAGAAQAAQRRAREDQRRAEEGAAKWQAAQDEAALRRQVADAKAQAQLQAARREERQRREDAEEEAAQRRAAEAEAARRRRLEEEADSIFAKALEPQQLQPVAASGGSSGGQGGARGRSRSVSGRAGSGGSRSISSRTARRRARSRPKGRRPDWTDTAGSALTGSRALLMNRDYVEDLPHLPRPSATGPPAAPARFGSRSRSRQRQRR